MQKSWTVLLWDFLSQTWRKSSNSLACCEELCSISPFCLPGSLVEVHVLPVLFQQNVIRCVTNCESLPTGHVLYHELVVNLFQQKVILVMSCVCASNRKWPISWTVNLSQQKLIRVLNCTYLPTETDPCHALWISSNRKHMCHELCMLFRPKLSVL